MSTIAGLTQRQTDFLRGLIREVPDGEWPTLPMLEAWLKQAEFRGQYRKVIRGVKREITLRLMIAARAAARKLASGTVNAEERREYMTLIKMLDERSGERKSPGEAKPQTPAESFEDCAARLAYPGTPREVAIEFFRSLEAEGQEARNQKSE
jgi:hypothetical protein